jgi:RNA polymerase sigma-70 factor (ECF subfamily)
VSSSCPSKRPSRDTAIRAGARIAIVLSRSDTLRHRSHMESAVTVPAESEASALVESAFYANERRLGQFLVQMVRDRSLAEDLLQETFVAAFNAQGRAADVVNLDAWLFGIARHRALVALRRTRRMRRAIERLGGRGALQEAEPVEVGAVMDVLERVLSPDDRSLVVLRYVHEFNATQLAELTGRSPTAIRKRLERACSALAGEIER